MEESGKNEPMHTITKREKRKGHYILVTRNLMNGQIVSVSKWSRQSGKDSENETTVKGE